MDWACTFTDHGINHVSHALHYCSHGLGMYIHRPWNQPCVTCIALLFTWTGHVHSQTMESTMCHMHCITVHMDRACTLTVHGTRNLYLVHMATACTLTAH